MASKSEFATELLRLLRRTGISQIRGGHLAPGIPNNKLNNSSQVHGELNGQCIGLIDLTIWGSAKKHILFTTEGMYFAALNAEPNAGFIPYSQFSNCFFKKKGFFDPRIDTGLGVFLPFISEDPAKLIVVLNAIRSLVSSDQISSTKGQARVSASGEIAIPMSKDQIMERAYNMEQAKNWDEAISLYEEAEEFRMAGLAREQKIRWEQKNRS